MFGRARSAALSVLAPLWCSCAAHVPPVPMDRFLSGDLAPVSAFFDEQLREGDPQSGALFLNGLAQIELMRGELDEARKHFRQAGRVMGNWQTSTGEVFGAIVGSESSKTWKGDPHERAMNAYYTGLCYWIRGEFDNARAAFKSGILADGESDEGAFQVDFALLYWLAGRMSVHMGIPGDAENYFEEARRARAFAVQHGAAGQASPPILDDPMAGNLVCVVDVGLGPRKVAGGRHDSLAVIVSRPGGPVAAEILLDGESLGRTALLADVDYQARTRGGREMEGIREGKALLKDVSAIGGVVLLDRGLRDHGSGRSDKLWTGIGLLALSLLTSPSADVRHWETLPRSVQVLTATVPPGLHDLRIVFLGGGGTPIPSLTQDWTVEVPESGESVYYFRSLPGLDQAARESS